ncbi:MAG: hypothetical protein ABW321_03700 [Polyangiales bacterium]
MRSGMRGLLGVWMLLLWPASVFAEPRVVVQNFKGPSGGTARVVVTKALQEHGFELVPPKKATAVARSSGAALDTESGRVRVAKKLKLDGFVTGKTRLMKKKQLQVEVTIYGADGMQSGEYKTVVVRAALKKELAVGLWDGISGAFSGSPREVADPLESTPEPPPPVASRTKPQPQPTQAPPRRERPPPAPVAEPDDELPPGVAAHDDEKPDSSEALAMETQADQEEPTTAFPPAFDIGVGAAIGTRSFGYNDSLPGLRTYSLGPSPNLAFHGHWYPAAHFSAGALAHLGLDVRADMLVGVSSKDKTGQEFSTSSYGLGIGLRARIPLDKLELGVVAGFGQRSFGLSSSSGVDPEVPDVTHNFLRLGGEGRYQLFRLLAVQLRAAFLLGLGLGELTDRLNWFPHATGNGVEGEIGFQLNVTQLVAVELAFGLQRYFMSLNPEMTDTAVVEQRRVAGGALDKYFSSRFGVIIRP